MREGDASRFPRGVPQIQRRKAEGSKDRRIPNQRLRQHHAGCAQSSSFQATNTAAGDCAIRDFQGMRKENHLWAARYLAVHLGLSGDEPKSHLEAKAKPAFRLHVVYDKICRGQSLRRAYRIAPMRLAVSTVGNESAKTRLGTATTLGLPQAVETRIARNGSCRVCVKMLLTMATTRPSQSSTGAPDAP